MDSGHKSEVCRPGRQGCSSVNGADCLQALFDSRAWLRRRVDRVEFLDLMTVRRTIVLTLDLGELAKVLPQRESSVIPLGWFIPWANAGAVLRDAEEHVVPCLTSEESDSLVQPQIEDRLRAVGITDDGPVGLIDVIRLHRKDAGLPGSECTSCTEPKCPLGDA